MYSEKGGPSTFAGDDAVMTPPKAKQPLGNDTSVATSGAGKIDLVHVEDIQNQSLNKTTRAKKVKRHFARYWCCYLVLGFVLAAILIPLLFTKIIPALAQDIIDKTNLPINGAQLKAVSNDQALVSLTTSLTIPAGLTVGLSPMNLSLYNADTKGGYWPYLSVPLPYESLTGVAEVQVENQLVTVGNRTEIHKWLEVMLYEKTAPISVKGGSEAHLGKLHFGVELDKTVTIDALRELEGFSLDTVRTVLPPDAEGHNIKGTLTIPNWSILSMGLGNVTLNAWAGDILVGSAEIYDVDLAPGNNTMPYKGTIFLETLIPNLVSILTSQATALTTGNIIIGANGNSTVVNGEHIEYLESVLQGLHLTANFPILQVITGVIQSVQDGDTDLDWILKELLATLPSFLSGLLGLGSSSGNSNSSLGGLLGSLNLTALEARDYANKMVDLGTMAGVFK